MLEFYQMHQSFTWRLKGDPSQSFKKNKNGDRNNRTEAILFGTAGFFFFFKSLYIDYI